MKVCNVKTHKIAVIAGDGIGVSAAVAVGNLDDELFPSAQFIFVYLLRAQSGKPFGDEHNSHRWVGKSLVKLPFGFLLHVDDHALYARKAHADGSVGIVADKIKSHFNISPVS